MPPLSLSEQNDLRIVVESFFGKAYTAHWEMNEELLKVVTKMIKESEACSEAMDFVPRPRAYLTFMDVKKELERMARSLLARRGASYWVCNLVSTYQWKMEAEIAGQGVNDN